MKFEYAIFRNRNTNQFIDMKKVEDGWQVRKYIFSSILGGQQTLEEFLFKTKKEALNYKKNKGFKLEGVE
ncbi:MAG: hypothetical protein ACRC7S_01155 [Cetobacterium sp.]